MKSKNDSYIKARKKSFRAAFKGITLILKESNFKVHLVLSFLTMSAAFLLEFNLIEWSILFICIFFVFTLEAFNTALEYMVDFVSPEYHQKAGQIKDIASGAVLIGAIGVFIIGLILFGTKLFAILN